MQQFLIGVSGALLGVIGWLLVGMYIQRRVHDREARDAARAVYFEVGANHLIIFTALEYGAFGALARATFDRLLPELATWLPAADSRRWPSPIWAMPAMSRSRERPISPPTPGVLLWPPSSRRIA